MSGPGIPASFADLEKARRQEHIVLQTAAQVKKDFGNFGLEIIFSGNPGTAYDELKEQLTERISEMLDHNYLKLKALLYQIDVAETGKEKILPHGESYAAWLAERILDREFLKVLTRMYFSETSGKSSDTGNTVR